MKLFICEGTTLVRKNHSPLRYVARKSGLDWENIEYPGSFFPIPYDHSVKIGIRELLGKVLAELDSDPEAQVRLIGYSQGARVVGDVLERLTQLGLHDRVKAIMISDPRHPGLGIELHIRPMPGITPKGNRGEIKSDVTRIYTPGDPISDFLRGSLLGYFWKHNGYHQSRIGSQPLLDWCADNISNPPDATILSER